MRTCRHFRGDYEISRLVWRNRKADARAGPSLRLQDDKNLLLMITVTNVLEGQLRKSRRNTNATLTNVKGTTDQRAHSNST